MNPKLRDFIQNLCTGTQHGILEWAATPEPGVYRLMLEKGLVRIYRPTHKQFGDKLFGCTVLNGEGAVLHDVQVAPTDDSDLPRLYQEVERRLQESALDDLLAEVRSKVGIAD